MIRQSWRVLSKCVQHNVGVCLTEWLIDWMNEWMNEWVSEWVSEWGREGGSEWVTVWLTDWLTDWMTDMNTLIQCAWIVGIGRSDWLVVRDQIDRWIRCVHMLYNGSLCVASPSLLSRIEEWVEENWIVGRFSVNSHDRLFVSWEVLKWVSEWVCVNRVLWTYCKWND